MKLLFDQNLSFKLCTRLTDLFPNSEQVRLLGMAESSDEDIWQYASAAGFNNRNSGFRLRGHGDSLWTAAKGLMVALRKSIDGIHRKATAPAFRSH